MGKYTIFKSIRVQLIVAFAATALLTAAAIGANSVFIGFEGDRQQIFNQLEAAVISKETQIAEWVLDLEANIALLKTQRDTWRQMEILLHAPKPRAITQRRLRKGFNEFITLTKQLNFILLLNTEGVVVASNRPDTLEQDYKKHPYFEQALTEPFFQPPHYFQNPEGMFVVVTQPVLSANGELLGVVAGFANLDMLNEITTKYIGLGETGEIYLVDLEHRLLTDVRKPDYDIAVANINTVGATMSLQNQTNGSDFYNNYHDIPVVGVYHWLPRLNVALVSEKEQAEVFQPIYTTLLTNIGLAVALACITIIVGLFLTRNITASLKNLAETALEISAGNLTLEAETNRRDEIGDLSRAFNSMTKQLRDSIDWLETRVQERTTRLETSAKISQQMASVLNIDELLQYVVNRIQTELDYYHTHIYLTNSQTNDLIMAHGSGEIGQTMKANGHRLAIGQGIVGTVAATRKHILSNNVSDTPDFVRNALLPDTCSELAVPLCKGKKLLGVLDIQSEKPDSFTLEDVSLLQSIADQMVVSIENARLISEMQQALLKLQEVDRLKSEFLTSMSHELRTPLNSILGFSDLLLEGISGDLSPTARQDIQTIHCSGQHLLTLINDILDISKIEAGMLELDPKVIDAVEVMDEVVAIASTLIKDKPIELRLEVDDKLPQVYADRTRLKQIFLNILENAIKFTNHGEIRLQATATGTGRPAMKFVISDTGIGIPKSKQELIFEPFKQVDMSKSRSYEGTGLGLAICKQLVEMHGGTIGVDSEEHGGSHFYFTIPLALYTDHGHRFN